MSKMLFLGSLLFTAPLPSSAQAPEVTPKMLLETNDISSLAISPDGVSVAFRIERASIERDDYETAWYVQDIDGGAPPHRVSDGGSRMTDGGGGAVLDLPQWSKDSKWIYYRALFNGEIQIWRAARNGSLTEPVTHDAANVRRFVLSQDGRRAIYEVAAARADIERAEAVEYDNGIRIDGTIYGNQNLYRSFPIEGRMASSRQFVTGEQTVMWNAATSVKVINLDDLSISDTSASDLGEFKERVSEPIYGQRFGVYRASSKDGTRVAALSGAYLTPSLQVSGLGETSKSIICGSCKNMAIEGISWRENQEVIFTVRNGNGRAQSLYAWAPDADKIRQIVRSDGLLSQSRDIGGTTCAPALRYAICVSASAAVPPRLDRIDLDTGKRTALFNPNGVLGQLVTKTVKAESMSWRDRNGVSFTGYLFTPAASPPGKRLPLFVTYYLCAGFLRGGFGDEWPLIALANHGIAAACVDKPPLHDNDAVADYESALSGVEALVGILGERGTIDPAKVGMGGVSFGAEVVNWIDSHSNLLSATSTASTAISPTWYWARSLISTYPNSSQSRWGLKSPDESPDEWRRVSPVYYAERFHSPMLMQLIEGEYRSSIEQFSKMRRAEMPVELWVYPNETHQKQRPRVKFSAYQRNLDWFDYWLRGYIDPDLRKVDQYRRWGILREQQSRKGLRNNE